MWLTCRNPLLHAPAREDRAYVVPILVHLEGRGCRDITFAWTNIMDFIETHVRVVELKSACKTQSLIDDLVAIDEGEGGDRFGAKRIAYKRSQPALRQNEHE